MLIDRQRRADPRGLTEGRARAKTTGVKIERKRGNSPIITECQPRPARSWPGDLAEIPIDYNVSHNTISWL
jgi:hypothetical protein